MTLREKYFRFLGLVVLLELGLNSILWFITESIYHFVKISNHPKVNLQVTSTVILGIGLVVIVIGTIATYAFTWDNQANLSGKNWKGEKVK